MPDNTQLDLGSGGDLISTDELGGGVKVQRVKIQYGVDGAATDVSDSNPLPVDDAGGSLTMDSAQLPAALVSGRLDVVVGAALPAGTNNIGDVDVLTLPALPAGTNNIGDVDVLSVPAPLNVAGSGTQAAAQRVTLATDSPLVASLLAEDAVAAANPTGFQLIARARSQPLPDEVPADDHVALNATRRGALHVRVPNADIALQTQFTATGNLDLDANGHAVAVVDLTYVGATGTVVFEGISGNGTIVQALKAINVATGANESSATASGQWVVALHGVTTLRVRCSAHSAGTIFAAACTAAGSTVSVVQSLSAHDAVATSINPLLLGAYASASAPSAVSADNDAVRLWANRFGAVQVGVRDGSGDSCMDDANNALRVNIVAGAGSGGTAMTDDAAFTVGSTSITPVGGYYLAARDAVNDGDAGAFAMTERRAIYATLETPGGDSVMDETNNAVQVRLVATDVASGGFAMADDATFTVGTTNVNPVAGIYRTSRDTVDDNDAGAFAMTQRRALYVTLETPGGDALVDDTNDHVKVGGAVAHDSANAGNINPLLIGARAANSPLSAVSADGDAAMLRSDRLGQLFVSLADAAGDSCMDGTNDALRVNVVAGAGGGVSHTDDAAFTVGTSPVVPAAGVFRVTRDDVNDGDAGAFAMTEFRAMCVTLEDPNGQEVGTSLRPIRVEVTGSTTQSVAWGDANITDAITALDDECMLVTVNGYGVLNFDVTGTWTATLQFEATLNLSDWFAITVYPLGSASGVTSTAANGRWYAHDLGFQRVRVRASAFTSGTAVVKICGSTSNWVSPASAGGGTQYQEDAAHASGDTGTLALAVRRDTAAVGSGTDGDYSTLSVNANGRLYTSTTLDAALPAGTNNIGDVDVLTLPALPAGTNNIGDVDVLTLPGITGAAAHDAAVSGNPVLVGLEARTSDGTAVGNGDAVRAAASVLGKQIILPFALPANQIQGNLTRTSTTSAGDIIAAQAAGIKIAVMTITVTNKHATQSTEVTIRDGTTAKFGPQTAAAAGGGFTISGGGFPLFVGTAATAVTGICSDSADVRITVTGFLTTE